MQYVNISSISCGKSEIFYTVGVTENAPIPGGNSISFNTMSGTTTSWIWAPVTINVGKAPRSSAGNQTQWVWDTITDSASYYVPSGSTNQWKWCVENA